MARLVMNNSEKKEAVDFTHYATIGRSSRCTLCIKDIKLSRVHCEIIQVEEDYILIDLHSQNGTKLNENLILETILCDGDRLILGKSEVIFHLS